MIANPSLPIRSLRRAWTAACLGVGLVISPLTWAQAPIEIAASVGGQQRELEASTDEVYVIRKGDGPTRGLKDLIESKVAGARVEDYNATRALVRLPRLFDHAKAALGTDEISAVVANAEIQPVLYAKGAPRNAKTRHFGTRDVLVKLPAGKTGEQLVAEYAAVSSRPSLLLDGHVMMRFATAYHALAATKALRAAGVESQPQIARVATKLAAPPLDEFFVNQWHLFNVGQGGGTPGVDANVLPAWDITRGNGVNIAIVDDGFQTNHPDLADNTPDIQSNLHYDFNDDDNDPRPGEFDDHGTAVGGVSAARQNNGAPNPADGSLRGVSGSAPESKVIGLRLISAPITDEEIADALFWKPANFVVGVSNNSWGYTDGAGLSALEPLTKLALQKATSEGRGGKGQVTVFAAGNGNQICCGDDPIFGFTIYPDNSNFSGLQNSRHVMAVAAVDNTGLQSFYSEPGANIMVTAPSNGGTLGVTTTDRTGVDGYNPTNPGNLPNTDYTNDFGGTSSSSPLTAGGAALLLSANINLGWRDVKEILASTARRNDPGDPDWMIRPLETVLADRFVNGGGFKFNHKYGGGMIDLRAATTRAISWANLGTEVSQTISAPAGQVPAQIPDGGTVTRVFNFAAFPNLRLEQIEVVTDISIQQRSQLHITITSPSGVVSVLAPNHPHPDFFFTFDDDIDYKDGAGGWTFSTTHHWGDNSITGVDGNWTLTIEDRTGVDGIGGVLNSATVRLWGTLAPQTRVLFEGPNYSVNEAQVPDPLNPGQFINATQTIRVRRLGPLGAEATVDYATTIGSATPPINPSNAPADYTPISGTLHFSIDQEYADTDISVEILDDSTPEPVEQINVVLNNPTGAALGGINFATIDLIDSEQNFVTVVATDNSAGETNVDVPVDTGTFTISRLTASADALTVRFNITGTATYEDFVTPGADYDHVDLFAVIPAFETSVTIIVKPKNDSAIEGVETVLLNIESDPAYAIGLASTGQIRIVDNDRQKVQIESLDNLAQENVPANTALMRLTRSVDVNAPNAFDEALLVDLSLSGTQRPSTNYMLQAGADILSIGPDVTTVTVAIPAGLTTLDLTIIPVNDLVYQATKTVVIGLIPNDEYDSGFGFLTSASARIVEDDPLPDTVIPTVIVKTPVEKQKISKAATAVVLASGTAKDNISVQRVSVAVNGRPAHTATLVVDPLKPGKVTWNVDITADLVLGSNVMTVIATDGDQFNSNDSQVSVVRFKYIEEHELNVTIEGSGSVTDGFLGTTTRNAGASLEINAKPATGFVFGGWFTNVPVPGTILTAGRKLLFTMPVNPPADASLKAVFIPTPFGTEITGNYTGLIQAPFFNHETSGLITLTVDAAGAFTASMRFGGQQLSFKGEFTAEPGQTASYAGSVPRGENVTPLTVSLTIDTDDVGSRRVAGTVNNGAVNALVVANRAIYSKANQVPGGLKNYTFYMPPAAPLGNSTKDPHGIGYGTVRISKKGEVTWTGTLADGTVVSQSTTLSKDGTWPLYLSLYNNKGVMLGVVTHANLTASDFSAAVDWYRPVKPNNSLFTAGFKIENADVFGAIYTEPAAGTRVLTDFDLAPLNKGTALINEGNLITTINKQIVLGTDNVITVDPPANPAKLRITVNPVSIPAFGLQPAITGGTFNGSFVHTISNIVTPISGIIYQKADNQQFIGSFLGASAPGVPLQSGRVIITPNPVVP